MNRARVSLLLLAVVGALARPAAGQWVKAYARDTFEIPCSVRETPDGGFVLSGISQHTSTDATEAMTWVGRLTPGGDVKWWVALKGATLSDVDNDFNGVVPVDDGGFLLAATHKEPSSGQSFLLATKLDDQGQVLWQRLYGWPGAGPKDRLFKVAAVEAASDGGLLVAGAATTAAGGPWHLWVARLDGAGDLLWQQAYPAASPGEAHALGQSAEGSIYVAGVNLAWGAGGYDFWVLKLDPAGRIIWQRSCGGPQSDIPRGLAATPDGGCLVVGESLSFGAAGSGRDSWAVKLDAAGLVAWQKLFSAAGEDWAEAVVATADGGFLVSGAAQKGPNTDASLLKITARGEVEWRRAFGSGSGFYKFSNEKAVDAVELRGGGFAAVGQTSEMGAYENDILVLKVTARGEADACASSRDDPLSATDTSAVSQSTTAAERPTTAVLSPFAAPALELAWISKPICPGKTKKARR